MPARLLSALALGLFIAGGAFAADAPVATGGKMAQSGAATAPKKTVQAAPVARQAQKQTQKQARKPGQNAAQRQARRQTQKSASKPVTRQAAKPAPRRVATSAATRAAVAAAAGAGAKRVAAADSDQMQATRRLAIASGAALVVDQEGGEAIYQKNADQVVPIASITKLMTAMVVLDAVPALHDTITITRDDVDTLRGSRSRLRVGARLTREDALLLALMSSENRASNALARHYPGGLSAFVVAMNRKAIELGMYRTRFEEPTGLSSNNDSTAQDLVRLVVAAHRYPQISEFSTRP
ncbi:MAG: serine hydrolase, partial [Azospira sp.]|nr:serine hydrolase [Azospira sp.]